MENIKKLLLAVIISGSIGFAPIGAEIKEKSGSKKSSHSKQNKKSTNKNKKSENKSEKTKKHESKKSKKSSSKESSKDKPKKSAAAGSSVSSNSFFGSNKNYNNSFKSSDKVIGQRPDGRTIYEGPRGGQYYFTDSGNKEYVTR